MLILELFFRALFKNMSDVINVKLSASTPEVTSEKKENYVRPGSLQSERSWKMNSIKSFFYSFAGKSILYRFLEAL